MTPLPPHTLPLHLSLAKVGCCARYPCTCPESEHCLEWSHETHETLCFGPSACLSWRFAGVLRVLHTCILQHRQDTSGYVRIRQDFADEDTYIRMRTPIR